MDTNPETPVVTTPTITVPSTTVQTLQSIPTLNEEITTASKESGICEDEILKLFVAIKVHMYQNQR